jgi:hypothetical protein
MGQIAQGRTKWLLPRRETITRRRQAQHRQLGHITARVDDVGVEKSAVSDVPAQTSLASAIEWGASYGLVKR